MLWSCDSKRLFLSRTINPCLLVFAITLFWVGGGRKSWLVDKCQMQGTRPSCGSWSHLNDIFCCHLPAPWCGRCDVEHQQIALFTDMNDCLAACSESSSSHGLWSEFSSTFSSSSDTSSKPLSPSSSWKISSQTCWATNIVSASEMVVQVPFNTPPPHPHTTTNNNNQPRAVCFSIIIVEWH